MNKLKKCNHALLILSPAVLSVSVILEISHGEAVLGTGFNIWVAAHLFTVMLLALLVFRNLRLNWGKTSGWPGRATSGRTSRMTKALCASAVLTLATGLAAIPQWLMHGHSTLGGIHGKIGFLFMILFFAHTLRHRKWFRK